jgi:hypothetical protein
VSCIVLLFFKENAVEFSHSKEGSTLRELAITNEKVLRLSLEKTFLLLIFKCILNARNLVVPGSLSA